MVVNVSQNNANRPTQTLNCRSKKKKNRREKHSGEDTENNLLIPECDLQIMHIYEIVKQLSAGIFSFLLTALIASDCLQREIPWFFFFYVDHMKEVNSSVVWPEAQQSHCSYRHTSVNL